MSVARRITVMSKSSVKCLQALVSAAVFLILVLLPVWMFLRGTLLQNIRLTE